MGRNEKETSLSWLQISDLHIFDTSMNRAVMESMEEHFKGRIHFLIVTGDLHQYESGPVSGIGNYGKTVEYLNELIQRLGIQKEDVFMLPGNHDVGDFADKPKAIESMDGDVYYNQDCYMEYQEQLYGSFSRYQSFVEVFYQDQNFYGENAAHTQIQTWRGQMDLLHLNTALTCNGDNKRKMIIDLMELSRLKREDEERPLIVIAHHSFFDIHPNQEGLCRRYLKSLNASAYLCGDAHRESIGLIDLEGRVIPNIVCGKTAPQAGDQWSRIGVIFYQADRGEVRTQPYKWNVTRLEPVDTFLSDQDLEKSVQQEKRLQRSFPLYSPKAPEPRKAGGINLAKIKRELTRRIRTSLLFPWLTSESASYSLIYKNLFVTPYVTDRDRNCRMSFTDFLESCRKEAAAIGAKNKICILGDAGLGKSSLLKYYFLEQVEEKKQVLYVHATDLNQGESDCAIYVKEVLDEKRKPAGGLTLLIDGIDEGFASDIKGLHELLGKVEKVNCEIWIGCRSQFYAQYAGNTCLRRAELCSWSDTQIDWYVYHYYNETGKPKLNETFQRILEGDRAMRDFTKNPFQLSILLFLIEIPRENPLQLKNSYALYKEFFKNWIQKEHKRGTSTLESSAVYEKLWRIARDLYDGRQAVADTDDTAVLGLLMTDIGWDQNKIARMFYHRSFMEFLLADRVLEAMKKDAEKLTDVIRQNNRSDVDRFIKAGFEVSTYAEKNRMAEHIIEAYHSISDYGKDFSIDEKFFVKNQAIYYLTRMTGMRMEPVKEFIRAAYEGEESPLMRQGIAYGAANMGMFDIALAFAKNMNPGSVEDVTNRSWTLVFYGDKAEEDPLTYVDDGSACWEKSRAARLRRISGKKPKDRAFRMFDLRILYTFFVSRGWKEQRLSAGELTLIRECQVEIPGYPRDVTEFLKQAKGQLLEAYEQQLALESQGLC